MARLTKQGGRKPIVVGHGGVWTQDGFNHETKEREYRLGFSGEDRKYYELVITEADSYEIVKALTSYHASAFAYEQKLKREKATP